MQPRHFSIGPFRGEVWTIPPAVLLGASSGLFVNGYWFVDLLPSQSRQLLLLTLIFGAGAALGYCLLLGWMRARWGQLSATLRSVLVIVGLLMAGFVFFGGTSQWREPGRYIGFLLPRHRLQLSVARTTAGDFPALTWFNTSLGDVSFDALDAQGWSRQGEQLVFNGKSSNALVWTGATGDRIQIVLQATSAGSTVVAAWDGQEETLLLPRGRTTYEHSFPVPYYASRGFIVALGLLNLLFLSAGLLLVLIQSESEWNSAIAESVAGGQRALDRKDLAAVLAALALALLLRGFNLAGAFPAVDEYYHLIAAQQLVQGAALGSVYQRGLWLVTLPVALALRVFGHQLWAARLVGVLFNTLAIIPLYLLVRKINRPIAVLSCVLYAISPWIITFARVAREYAFYPFYFYCIIYGMAAFVEAIPAAFVLRRDWRLVLTPKVIGLAAVLCLPPFFGLAIDWLSTFRTILIAYLVFGLLVLARFNWTDRRNWPILGFLGAGLLFGARTWYLEQSGKLLTWPRFNGVPLQYFLPNPQQQWYFDRVVVTIALALIAGAVYAWLSRRATFIALFMYLLLGAYLMVFAGLSKTFFHTRHLLTTQLWYVVVVAIGLYAFWTVLLAVVPLRRGLQRVALGLILGLAITNGAQILLPSVSTNPDMPISEDYLHDMSKIQEFMLGRVQPNDVLISTVYGLYAAWEEAPEFRTQYRITSATPKEDILRLVENNSSGWIVVDQIRLDISPLSARDFTGVDQIEYIGMFGDEYVWRWQRTSGWTRPLLGLE